MITHAPQRIQLSRKKGFKLPAGAVNCARPTPWGNPFVVGKHGDAKRCVELFALLCLGHVDVTQNPAHVRRQNKFFDHLQAHLGDLRGRDLACSCRLGDPCHRDVLLKLANK